MKSKDEVAVLREELREAEKRIEEFHEILDRKNAIILMLAMGDNAPSELVNVNQRQACRAP